MNGSQPRPDDIEPIWGAWGEWPSSDGAFDMQLHPDAGSPQGVHAVTRRDGVWDMGTFGAVGLIDEDEQGLFRFRRK